MKIRSPNAQATEDSLVQASNDYRAKHRGLTGFTVIERLARAAEVAKDSPLQRAQIPPEPLEEGETPLLRVEIHHLRVDETEARWFTRDQEGGVWLPCTYEAAIVILREDSLMMYIRSEE